MQTVPQNGDLTQGGVPRRVLPPAVWDRLKAKAEEVGGVREGQLFDPLTREPCCLAGIACATGDIKTAFPDRVVSEGLSSEDSISAILRGAYALFDGGFIELDRAIHAARQKKFSITSDEYYSIATRVPFEDVMAQLNISRGAPTDVPYTPNRWTGEEEVTR